MRAVKKLVVLLIILAAAGFGAYHLLSPKPEEPSGGLVRIYLIESTPTEFFLVPVDRQIKGEPSPNAALQALLDGPLADEELLASVPKSTKLLDLVVRDKLAVASFSSEIKDDFHGGSLIEAYLVEAIVNTLTEFPEIESVQILVEGEAVESIGGHIYIRNPLRRKD
ncbi:MAG: GerMN domain-containing protein [Bacillota bacterium]|jgi:germination protein M|nr:GerMN domain-containing protein [Bacillota bacterium]NLJ03350.1 GerMN domain-containing protein [Bacillota bacterium]